MKIFKKIFYYSPEICFTVGFYTVYFALGMLEARNIFCGPVAIAGLAIVGVAVRLLTIRDEVNGVYEVWEDEGM